jgi:glyoxylase I family protein
MRAVGVHHVSVNVSDVPEAVALYVDVLGLTQRNDRPDFGFDGAWLDLGAQQVYLIEATPPADHGQHFALEVEDLDAIVDELRRRGVQVTAPAKVRSGRQSFLHDPSVTASNSSRRKGMSCSEVGAPRDCSTSTSPFGQAGVSSRARRPLLGAAR